ncbi:MAG: hypothetical protein ACKVT2_19195 [Saprospiraceae bacterium]
MKKLLFALPILAIAFIFSFCDRANLHEELSNINPNEGASDRMTCNVQFDKASPTVITLCGTNTNANNCISCTGGKSQGLESIPAGVSPFFLTLTTPIEFYATSATGNTLTVTTAAGQVVVSLPAGVCKTIKIDASCNVTAF